MCSRTLGAEAVVTQNLDVSECSALCQSANLNEDVLASHYKLIVSSDAFKSSSHGLIDFSALDLEFLTNGMYGNKVTDLASDLQSCRVMNLPILAGSCRINALISLPI